MEKQDNDDFLACLPGSHTEDFITEAFCWLLARGFGDQFLDRLTGLEWMHEMPSVGRGCRWTTQETHRLDDAPNRLDMVCESSDRKTALIFEHKVDAKLAAAHGSRDPQLVRYGNIAKREFDRSAVVLITRRHSQLEQSPDCHLLWSQVYRWLSMWLDSSGPQGALEFAARGFLHLLLKRGLGPMEKIEQGQLRAIPVARTAEAWIMSLADRVASDAHWNRLPVGRAPARGRRMERTEGRCGAYLLGDGKPATWNPDLFVGVMVDGRDHGPMSVTDEGPVACVVLDIHRDRHRDYREGDAYRALAEAIRRRVPSDEGWEVHEARNNRWHPMTIYRPLEDVFGRADNGDALAAFVMDVRGVAEAVLGLDEFTNFRRTLAAKPD